MAQLLQQKWLRKRKCEIDGRYLKWKWGPLEKKHQKMDRNLCIEEYIEYPSNFALAQDLNCELKVKFYNNDNVEYIKLMDIGHKYPYQVLNFLMNPHYMTVDMDQWAQRNAVPMDYYYGLNDILYLKDVDNLKLQ